MFSFFIDNFDYEKHSRKPTDRSKGALNIEKLWRENRKRKRINGGKSWNLTSSISELNCIVVLGSNTSDRPDLFLAVHSKQNSKSNWKVFLSPYLHLLGSVAPGHWVDRWDGVSTASEKEERKETNEIISQNSTSHIQRYDLLWSCLIVFLFVENFFHLSNINNLISWVETLKQDEGAVFFTNSVQTEKRMFHGIAFGTVGRKKRLELDDSSYEDRVPKEATNSTRTSLVEWCSSRKLDHP